MRLFRDTTTFGGPTWVLIDECWIYTASSLLGLLLYVVTHWRTDADLVG